MERARLNPATYGRVSGVSPAVSPEPKIILYTDLLGEGFWRTAVAVDRYVGKNPKLAWSFVQVRDVKGAQRGGYTADELRARIAEIAELTRKRGIRHLLFVIAAPGRGEAEPSDAVTLAYTSAKGKSDPFPTVSWVTQIPASSVTDKILADTLASLDAVVRKS